MFLIVIHVIACLVLVVVILLQAGKGGGLSEAFGAGSSSTIFGTSASKFLQRITAICAALFLITSLSLTVLSSRRSRSLMRLEHLKKTMPDIEKTNLPLPVEAEEIDKAEEAPLEEEVPVKE